MLCIYYDCITVVSIIADISLSFLLFQNCLEKHKTNEQMNYLPHFLPQFNALVT